ncbi:hypothetical protein ZHAS_00014872 [Anopheles sinensis]|uniref:Uncharacterized protein n=1 Tax=Anopheles sinensis TaxID=74873 RepID=A0A084W9H1_ANOSI|nr:hypothetical protein ZHAS_00014872 [Anopheles sinensis]
MPGAANPPTDGRTKFDHAGKAEVGDTLTPNERLSWTSTGLQFSVLYAAYTPCAYRGTG